MRTHIVAIGNSKGIRIPKVILEQCHIEDEVDLLVKGDSITIKPAKHVPRKNWDKAFELMHQRGEDNLIISDSLDLDMESWQW